jgi:hypothetical protein
MKKKRKSCGEKGRERNQMMLMFFTYRKEEKEDRLL